MKCKTTVLSLFLLCSCLFTVSEANWESRGIGGGGALFSPSISPHDTDELYLYCDMYDAFHSVNFGTTWNTLHFQQLQGGNITSWVQFTSDQNVLYALDFAPVDGNDATTATKSTDGGSTWSHLTGDPTENETYSVFADPNRTDRVIVSSYDTLYFSDDGGTSFSQIYSTDELHVGGAFFDGSNIFLGTQAGLLISTDAGKNFSLSSAGGMPANQYIASFVGAKQGSTTRLFCVTAAEVFPGVTGADHSEYRGVYRLNYGDDTNWSAVTKGIGSGDHPFFVSMARDNVSVAYLGGGSTSFFPIVYKTTDGGGSWQEVLLTANNENIYTGWQGDKGDQDWWYGEYVLGLNVCPTDPDRVVITDLGFPHLTKDGGTTWRQAYVNPADENPPKAATPKKQYYRGNGIENTSCWWMEWSDTSNVL